MMMMMMLMMTMDELSGEPNKAGSEYIRLVDSRSQYDMRIVMMMMMMMMMMMVSILLYQRGWSLHRKEICKT